MHYAGFWQRFIASIIDAIIVSLTSMVMGFTLGLLFGLLGGIDNELANTIGGLLGFILSWLYAALLESSSKQATYGKTIMGLRVSDINGKPISFLRATGRHFAKYISAIIFSIGFIMVAFTSKKQGLHDMLAGTVVTKN